MLIKTKPLLRQQQITVSDECDVVTLKVGNAELRMPYDTAIQLSAWLRLHGRRAKRFAGDRSRTMTGIALLSDAASQ